MYKYICWRPTKELPCLEDEDGVFTELQLITDGPVRQDSLTGRVGGISMGKLELSASNSLKQR